jgi:hypothetical protein
MSQFQPEQPPNPFSSDPQQRQWESPAPPYPPQYQPQMPPQQQWQQQPLYAPPPPAPKKPGKGKFVAIGCGGLVALVVLVILIAAIASAGGKSSTAPTSNTAQPTATLPTQHATTPAKPTQAPKPTQVPTLSPAQAEQAYKASATDTTVANLDKEGNNGQGNIVHFTATILGFVKDNSGNTAGANVDDPNTSGVIQVEFPGGTNISQLNTGDTLEVWGEDGGTASGTNAFGATIQEVFVSAMYMTDKTTGYQAG